METTSSDGDDAKTSIETVRVVRARERERETARWGRRGVV
tara:strand:+ start:150 stop:269 length:120 start_codon:yes stop_codon:yes gene_type:complete